MSDERNRLVTVLVANARRVADRVLDDPSPRNVSDAAHVIETLAVVVEESERIRLLLAPITTSAKP